MLKQRPTTADTTLKVLSTMKDKNKFFIDINHPWVEWKKSGRSSELKGNVRKIVAQMETVSIILFHCVPTSFSLFCATLVYCAKFFFSSHPPLFSIKSV